MKKVGLKYPVAAIYNDSTGTPVYSDGFVIAKAMSANIQIYRNNERLHADDDIDEIDQSFIYGTESLGINELTLEKQSILLGHALENGELKANQDDIAPYLGHGFYGRIRRDGADKWRAIWFHKMQFGEPNDETETKGEKVAFKTPTIESMIMKDINGDWKSEKVFDTEADAIAWLHGKVGLPVTASSGLTDLALTGTGGALTPSFAAGKTLYTFSGVTAASVTVTATAANHTLKLYVDDVFNQNLTSGVASSAINMAIGSKKLKIVAQEAGKTSQTTEIVVVKIS
jgi:phi13 family phage major tail protein